MAYEVDFVGIKDSGKDADAIAMRWQTQAGKYVNGVYDGGTKGYGEELQNILNQYYFDSNEDTKELDFVICSHSDQDHASGLKGILENYDVKALYMNRPWLYVTDVFDRVNDGRITEDSLARRLRESYKYIAELEDIAKEKNIPIYEAFQGNIICDKLTVLSPTKELYLELMVESSKTPLEYGVAAALKELAKRAYSYVKSLVESWTEEQLREDVKTEPENEMSVVVLGEMDEETFLLTGDAGIRGLDIAIAYSDFKGKSIVDNISFMQIPHHGSRHNVSPSILNRLVGNIVKEGNVTGKVAYVSAAVDSDHPLQMVVNAFIRRGVKVYKTKGATLHHYRKTPDRGWISANPLTFSDKVEEWNE